MKFAHLADCHLGSWSIPELEYLSFKSFSYAIDECIKEKVDFILIAGDLFDSAYPPIDVLKQTFREFRKLLDAKILVFLIAGSHDYSVSGKTFLEVLEKAGFCKDVSQFEEKNGNIILSPTQHQGIAIYGYPGKKSSLETEEIPRIILQDSPGMFRILMLHTAIKDAVPQIADIKSIDEKSLPEVDYVALGHIHTTYAVKNKVYPGPTFPNNISELEELQHGSFYIFNNGNLEKKEIKLKEIYSIRLEVKNTLDITERILSFLEKEDISDKIVILRLFGILEQGKISDINFKEIESFALKKGAFTFLKSTSKLHLPEPEISISSTSQENMEGEIIKNFEEMNKSKFNTHIGPLLKSLQIEKPEGEKFSTYEERLMSEVKKTLNI